MSRIESADPSSAEPRIKAVDAQAKKWGKPLANHLLYAHRPSIFKGARGMWGGLDDAGLFDQRTNVALGYADAMTTATCRMNCSNWSKSISIPRRLLN